MQEYFVVTTCMLFVQCFDIHHNKIFEEIKKENLRNSLENLNNNVSVSSVKDHLQVRKKSEVKVKSGDTTVFKGDTNFLNFSALPSYEMVNFRVNNTRTTPFSGIVTHLKHIAPMKVQNTHIKNFFTTSDTLIQENSQKSRPIEAKQITLPLNDYLNLHIETTSTSIKISLEPGNHTELSRSISDSMKDVMKPPKGLSPVLPYILAPALTMAGILPWVLPGIRMAAGFVHMINQMAFMAGLFALVRGYIFDHRPDEHVVYVNHGYQKHNKHGHEKHNH